MIDDDVLLRLQEIKQNHKYNEQLVELSTQPGFHIMITEIEGLLLKLQTRMRSIDDPLPAVFEWRGASSIFDLIQNLVSAAHVELDKNYNLEDTENNESL